MDQQSKQGYRLHCALSNLNHLEVDQLDDADRERIEKARVLLEDVSLLTRPESEEGPDVQTES